MKKLLLVMGTLLLGILFTGCGEKKVDLSDYCDISYSGLNGQATASCEMKFTDLEDVWKKGQDQNQELLDMILSFEDSIEVSLDKTENIKNGDKLTATITCDEDLAKKHKYKFTGLKKEVKVKGLSDGTEVDLFKDISLEYEGVAPEAKVKICNASDDAFLKTVDYTADNRENLSNGDTITVTASYNEDTAAQNEYIVKETKKSYTVSGVDEYLKEYNQIDDKTLEKLKKQSTDLIESALADEYIYSRYMYPDDTYIGTTDISKVKIQSMKLEKAYFFNLKDGMDTGWDITYNSIFMVYKVASTDAEHPKGVSAYITVYYKNFIKRDTGDIDVVVTDGEITDSYSNMDNLYRDVVTVNKADYNFEEVEY